MVQPPDYYTLMAMQARSRSDEHEREHRASLVKDPVRLRPLLARLMTRPLTGDRRQSGQLATRPGSHPMGQESREQAVSGC